MKSIENKFFYFDQNLPPRPMFEICEANPFDMRNKKVDHNEGKSIF